MRILFIYILDTIFSVIWPWTATKNFDDPRTKNLISCTPLDNGINTVNIPICTPQQMRIVFINTSGYNLFVIFHWTITKIYDDLQTDNLILFTLLDKICTSSGQCSFICPWTVIVVHWVTVHPYGWQNLMFCLCLKQADLIIQWRVICKYQWWIQDFEMGGLYYSVRVERQNICLTRPTFSEL